ncbi:hypothetical protein G3M48_006871 [Beauveria asiatica]|uniref:Uncharacterized protein n=1 Tax=Beauveria asiatica TaxID=1069075 RepID=A0AAW0RP80_9HYPO
MSNGTLPLILPPSTPRAFLTRVLDTLCHPTTILICASRSDFLHAAVSELHDTPAPSSSSPSSTSSPPPDVLSATLARVATSRHIRVAFAPSVVHLRAYLSVFPATKPVAAPPLVQQQKKSPALLLVYGFLDVHRDGSEWSAQGIGCTAACVVEAARRGGLLAALMEPKGWGEDDGGGSGGGGRGGEQQDGETRWAAYEEQIPLLSTTASVREDGTWGVPCTSARTILQRWFTFDDS